MTLSSDDDPHLCETKTEQQEVFGSDDDSWFSPIKSSIHPTELSSVCKKEKIPCKLTLFLLRPLGSIENECTVYSIF